jgi:GH35 family endo-1,4-beta-xylanase
MAMELDLIPQGTRLTENGETEAQDIGASATRTFLCSMFIADQIEQESIDISVWGSTDGQNWGARPLLMMPQRFYRGETRQILDLSLKPEIRFIRARWEMFRWGRVAPHPMFVAGFRLSEVPAFARPEAAKSTSV